MTGYGEIVPDYFYEEVHPNLEMLLSLYLEYRNHMQTKFIVII